MIIMIGKMTITSDNGQIMKDKVNGLIKYH